MRFSTTLAPAKEDAQITLGDIRISVITDRIIRIEKGAFTDKRTQAIMCRNFHNTQFKSAKLQNKVSIRTQLCTFTVDINTLETSVKFADSNKTASPSNASNLGGTARTLDGTFGVLGGWKGKREKKDHFCLGHIRRGIFSTDGVAEYDDTKSVLLDEDGGVSMREGKCVDKYIFAFGDDYLGGLYEFYQLTGKTPVLPKYALSNWWSRYHAYTDKEYLALMDKFAKKDVPLTVATIDMDWHIVKDVPKGTEYHSMQGAGWTGYTFEKSLFPDYKGFLKGLKQRGLAVTMNLHPRDGVRSFEVQYRDMANACGINPDSGKTVQFDLTDKRFLNAYFDILHHPYEQDGVDFWWIDWQQGTKSKMKGLDPLWLLNHYHFLDNCRNGQKGLILSRYAGLGSHRYPLGFSGDTLVCWKSLKFQPYFTALASNAGYTWWSHDIGGHMYGKGNEDLYLRWLQFGVFSPINRLHSNNKAWSKEPWLYPHVEEAAESFLRLRHRLLPFLYTASVRTSEEGVPLIAPMYYYNKCEKAYSKKYRNQYYFGEQLLVSPITSPSKCYVARKNELGEKMLSPARTRSERSIGTNMTSVSIWLPDGVWFDFFTGLSYGGGREFKAYYALKDYPVFAKAGAIIPLLAERKGNSTSFDELEIRLFAGEGEYTMHDEQGSIAFKLEKTSDGYTLSVTPTADIITKKLKLVMMAAPRDGIKYTASCDGAVSPVDNEITVDCKPLSVFFKQEKFD